MIIKIDYDSDIPVYKQIKNEIILGIASGEINENQALPSVRALANEAGVNMMTAQKAYQLLKNEGIILTDERKCAIVSISIDKKEFEKKLYEQLRILISECMLAGVKSAEFGKIANEVFEKLGGYKDVD